MGTRGSHRQYTKGGRTVTLSAQEFIRRFLLHVLPHGFVKLRHYGLWASGRAQEKLEQARVLLAAVVPSNSPPAQIPAPSAAALVQDLAAIAETDETTETDEQEERTLQQRLLRLCGIDLTRCPKCQTGVRVTVKAGEGGKRERFCGRCGESIVRTQ